MSNLKTVSSLVKQLLAQNVQARNSDNFLYLKVLEYHAEQKGIDLSHMTVPVFLNEMEHRGFPGFETVRRSRQKVQATYPELGPTDEVCRFRSRNEHVYRGFAVSEV